MALNLLRKEPDDRENRAKYWIYFNIGIRRGIPLKSLREMHIINNVNIVELCDDLQMDMSSPISKQLKLPILSNVTLGIALAHRYQAVQLSKSIMTFLQSLCEYDTERPKKARLPKITSVVPVRQTAPDTTYQEAFDVVQQKLKTLQERVVQEELDNLRSDKNQIVEVTLDQGTLEESQNVLREQLEASLSVENMEVSVPIADEHPIDSDDLPDYEDAVMVQVPEIRVVDEEAQLEPEEVQVEPQAAALPVQATASVEQPAKKTTAKKTPKKSKEFNIVKKESVVFPAQPDFYDQAAQQSLIAKIKAMQIQFNLEFTAVRQVDEQERASLAGPSSFQLRDESTTLNVDTTELSLRSLQNVSEPTLIREESPVRDLPSPEIEFHSTMQPEPEPQEERPLAIDNERHNRILDIVAYHNYAERELTIDDVCPPPIDEESIAMTFADLLQLDNDDYIELTTTDDHFLKSISIGPKLQGYTSRTV